MAIAQMARAACGGALRESKVHSALSVPGSARAARQRGSRGTRGRRAIRRAQIARAINGCKRACASVKCNLVGKDGR
jgi:hypothetical protein